jgi:uncharacterized integral membrane protein
MGPEILFLLWPVPLACLAYLIFQVPRRWRIGAFAAIAMGLTGGWFLLPVDGRGLPALGVGFAIVVLTVLYCIATALFCMPRSERRRP